MGPKTDESTYEDKAFLIQASTSQKPTCEHCCIEDQIFKLWKDI
jgi:hypothetical protein